MILFRLFFTLSVLLLTSLSVLTPAPVFSQDRVEYLSSCLWSDFDLYDVRVDGDFAFAACYEGLMVFDLHDPANPEPLSLVPLPRRPLSLRLHDGNAFLAVQSGSLQIVDISDPTALSIAGSYEIGSPAVDLHIADGIAYISAINDERVVLMNIEDPSNPVWISNYFCSDIGSPTGMDLSDGLLYVAKDGWSEYPGGLEIVDVSNPAAPFLVSTYDSAIVGYSVTSAFVRDSIVFIGGDYLSLGVVNAANPAAPTQVDNFQPFPSPAWHHHLFVDDDHAYATADFWTSGYDTSLYVLNISDAANPFVEGRFATRGPSVRACAEDTIVFLCNTVSTYGPPSRKGLQIVNVADPTHPTEIGHYDIPASLSKDVFVNGRTAFVSSTGDSVGAFDIVDFSDRSRPIHVGSYRAPHGTVDSYVSNDHAFLAAGDSGLLILDISDPSLPILAGSFSTGGNVASVAVADDRACITDVDSGFYVLDVGNPSSPKEIGRADSASYARDVAIRDSLAFVLDNWRLEVYSIIGPAAPQLVGWCTTLRNATRLCLHDDFAFTTDGDLQIYNISDPANMALVGTYVTPGTASGVAVQDTLAFVADGSSQILVFNISDPTAPALIDSCETPDNTQDIAIQGNTILVADLTSLLLLTTDYLGCCTGMSVGNVDGSADDLVTMSDLTVLIDHLFIGLTPLECTGEGNIDMSPDGLVTMGDLTVLIDHLFISLDPLPSCP